MIKEDYIKIVNDKINNINSKNIMIKQINEYYDILEKYKPNNHKYKINDLVYLKKGTLLHGTYKNLEGLKEIVNNGLIASLFTNERTSKYPGCVGVWNLKEDYYLKNYINFYSGGTFKYSGLLINNEYSQEIKTEIIPYNKMNKINDYILNNPCRIWNLEQTKESRFLPSLIQDKVQIGIIFNGNNDFVKNLLKCDILDCNNIHDLDVKDFVNEYYYEQFILDRKNKDDFFTDRESAIIFGIPACFIEGTIVGRIYEFDNYILNEIKKLLPNCYICNLEGKVIIE